MGGTPTRTPDLGWNDGEEAGGRRPDPDHDRSHERRGGHRTAPTALPHRHGSAYGVLPDGRRPRHHPRRTGLAALDLRRRRGGPSLRRRGDGECRRDEIRRIRAERRPIAGSRAAKGYGIRMNYGGFGLGYPRWLGKKLSRVRRGSPARGPT